MTELKYGGAERIHYQYWTPELLQELKEAEGDLPRMAAIGLKVMERMPDGLHLVSGPITTGGAGTAEKNLLVLGKAIEYLTEKQHLTVFSQRPFHDGLVAFYRKWAETAKPGDYCWNILSDFYAPLFASKKFRAFHFIHGYESSVGARWEHDQALQYGYECQYLPQELSSDLLQS